MKRGLSTILTLKLRLANVRKSMGATLPPPPAIFWFDSKSQGIANYTNRPSGFEMQSVKH